MFDIKPVLILLAGVALGALKLLPDAFFSVSDVALKGALLLLFICIGLDMGQEERLWSSLKKMDWRTLTLPVAAFTGSITGGILAGLAVGVPVAVAASASAGCGYYSITMILMKEVAGLDAATLGFISNLLREMSIIVAMPLVVRLFGKNGAVGAAGATAMDTALPFIVRSAGKDIAVLSFVSGVVLTLIIPFAIPLIYKLFS